MNNLSLLSEFSKFKLSYLSPSYFVQYFIQTLIIYILINKL